MLKIFRYLKDNILSVILIILLLIVQANCDLTIPQYTSNIINVGVQQGGIEEVNPEVVRKSKLDEILLFVSDKEKEEILSNYELVTEKSDEHDYDILSEEPVYVIKDESISNSDLEKAILVDYMLTSEESEAVNIQNEIKKDMPSTMQNMSIIDIIEMLPADELNEANINRAANLYKISEYYDSLGMRNQAGDSMVSYADYWRDLQKTVEDDSASGNNVNLLLAYKEMISQIANNAANFKSAGVTRQQMENELNSAVKAVNNMEIIPESATAGYEQELKDNLIASLNSAGTIVNSTFNTENLVTDTQGGEQDAADTAAD